MMSPRERYHTDPAFAVLVKTMIAHIRAANYTPTELREAALLAHIIYNEMDVGIKVLPLELSEWLDGRKNRKETR